MLYNITPHISYLSYKDYKLRQKSNILFELNIKLLKFLLKDRRIAYNLKFLLKTKYLSYYGFFTNRYRQSCIISGKTRFIFNYFNLNRSTLKFYKSCGWVAGFRRF